MRGYDWILMLAIGATALALGVRGFYLREHVGLIDAAYAGLLVIPATALLFVASYVFQHARLAVAIPIVIAGSLAGAYPSFSLALGVVLIAAGTNQALRERSTSEQRAQWSRRGRSPRSWLLPGIARCHPDNARPELRSSGPYPFAPAAINCLLQRHPFRGMHRCRLFPLPDRGHGDRRDEDLRPAVDGIMSVRG